MSKKCNITNKKAIFSNSRSHAMNKTRRRWMLNLRKITIVKNGVKKRINVSVSTYRTLKKKNKLLINNSESAQFRSEKYVT